MMKQCGSYINHLLDFPCNFPYTQSIFQKITIYWGQLQQPGFLILTTSGWQNF